MSASSFSRRICPVVLVLMASVGLSGAAAAQESLAPVDAAVEQAVARGAELMRVIVRVVPEERAALKKQFCEEGYTVRQEFALTSALTLEVPAEEIDALRRVAGVRSVSMDAPVRRQASRVPAPQAQPEPGNAGGTPAAEKAEEKTPSRAGLCAALIP